VELTRLYSSVKDREMREQLIFVYSQRNEPAALDKLIEIARSDSIPELRKRALFWLGQSDQARAVQAIQEILEQHLADRLMGCDLSLGHVGFSHEGVSDGVGQGFLQQGIPLTPRQKVALGDLLDFNDAEDDQVLYINEIPRPSEPWHVILNRIVPHLLTCIAHQVRTPTAR
jgi:hypothetical protein